MAVSYVFRQSFRRPSTRVPRRVSVVLFSVALAAVLVSGGMPSETHTWWPRTLAYLVLFPILFFDKPSSKRGIVVTSLDDRAMLKYGAEYEALNPEQQRDILDHYRVGNYIFPRPPEQVTPKQSLRQYLPWAYRIYVWGVPLLALLYWAGWHWLPSGYMRTAWTNVAVVIPVVLVSMLTLPMLLKLWNEPD